MYLATLMLLGSGELGREFAIAAKRLGCRIIACDRYANAPAMQLADDFEVFSMLDGAALRAAVEKHKPDVIVPEIEAIDTGALAELTNFSTRGLVGTGQNVIVAGFITNGSTQVVVRGLGPTLAQFGVSQALADPVVSLFDGNGDLVSTNNNWKDKQQAAIEAAGLAPPNDLEAVILAPVAAGNYTAILSGNGGATGIGLVEIYKL